MEILGAVSELVPGVFPEETFWPSAISASVGKLISSAGVRNRLAASGEGGTCAFLTGFAIFSLAAGAGLESFLTAGLGMIFLPGGVFSEVFLPELWATVSLAALGLLF